MPGVIQSVTPNLSQPTYNVVPLDQGTNNLINQDIGIANQTPQQFAQKQNQGVAQGAQMAQQSGAQASQEDARMGYSSGAINQAIRNQFNAQAGSRIQNLQDAYNQNAVFQKNAAVQSAAAAAMARQNIQTQSYQGLLKAYNDTETARAQVLQSIFGGVGMGAGAYMGAQRRSPAMRPSPYGNMSATMAPDSDQMIG